MTGDELEPIDTRPVEELRLHFGRYNLELLDGVFPVRWATEPYCPRGRLKAIRGVLFVSPKDVASAAVYDKAAAYDKVSEFYRDEWRKELKDG